MNKIRIVIVEDQQLIRQLWVNMFADTANIKVVGESGKQDEAIELIGAKRPDIVLLDINLEQGSGVTALPLIRKISPGSRIIVLTMHSQPAYAKQMLQLGAKGYVTKNSTIQEILKAIDEVMQNRVYICEDIRNSMPGTGEEGGVPKETGIKNLSLREMEVVKLIKNGLSSKEISSKLFIGLRTVEVHRQNILKKLKLKNAASIVNFINHTDLTFL